MILSELKSALRTTEYPVILQMDGKPIAPHYHLTEAGHKTKSFVDCGGTLRKEERITFQVWVANDYDHRLTSAKWLSIINSYESNVLNTDLEVEIEFQQDTIGLYGLSFDGRYFHLVALQTDCLAPDRCGIPMEKQKVALEDLGSGTSCCTPGSGCC
jgi:Family of unknown function (DUF6428)